MILGAAKAGEEELAAQWSCQKTALTCGEFSRSERKQPSPTKVWRGLDFYA